MAQATNIRDYDNARMHRIALALWGALLVELRDDEGRVYIPMGEVEDAASLLLGVIISTAPCADVPSQLREHCEHFGRRLADRVRAARKNPRSVNLFDVVMTEQTVFQ